MTDQHSAPPKARSMQWRATQWWQWVARRIRVPLGFLTAALFLFECTRRAPHPAAIAWSLALVLPGLVLRAAASGTVKKNLELTMTGPYAHTRNPLYLGSMLMAAGFALALLSWPFALLLAVGFAVIYIPVIASEERFLRAAFPGFDAYCRRVPRFIPRVNLPFKPRLTPAGLDQADDAPSVSQAGSLASAGGFSFALYRKHREYNAAIGAALLYLNLLYLRPVLGVILHQPR